MQLKKQWTLKVEEDSTHRMLAWKTKGLWAKEWGALSKLGMALHQRNEDLSTMSKKLNSPNNVNEQMSLQKGILHFWHFDFSPRRSFLSFLLLL